MTEVTERNFGRKYDDIVNELQDAVFISIDCEFTGFEDESNEPSLFDNAETRFNKMQNTFQNKLIIQMGLSVFRLDKMHNKYNCSTYTFYLMPWSMFKNVDFTCQTKSMNFLSECRFDFNKLFYEGITYLNRKDEKELMKMIERGHLTWNSDNLGKVMEYCAEVSTWSMGVGSGSEKIWELDERDTFVYMLHKEIRRRFPNLWTFETGPKVLGVRKVKEADKEKLHTKKEMDELNKKIFDSLLGFTRLMKEIKSLRKTIVGHNFLADLIMIYKQFFNSSPVTYKKFKKEISKIFPNVYDTKRLSFVLKDMLPKEQTFRVNNLSNLYSYLLEGKGTTLVMFSPQISHNNEEDLNERSFHDAGFDSYCTGFCYLKIAHIFCMMGMGNKSSMLFQRTIVTAFTFHSIKHMKNQINLVKAQVHYICLDKEDPDCSRPNLIYFESVSGDTVDVKQMLRILGIFSMAEIQLLSHNRGLIAVGNHEQARQVLSHYAGEGDLKMTKYSFLKHTTLGKVIETTAMVATVALVAAGATMAWRKVFN